MWRVDQALILTFLLHLEAILRNLSRWLEALNTTWWFFCIQVISPSLPLLHLTCQLCPTYGNLSSESEIKLIQTSAVVTFVQLQRKKINLSL